MYLSLSQAGQGTWGMKSAVLDRYRKPVMFQCVALKLGVSVPGRHSQGRHSNARADSGGGQEALAS